MGAAVWRSEAEAQAFKTAKTANLAPLYTTKKAVSNCKVSTVVIATETNSKDEVIVRTINSYDKKKHPKAMQKELVF